MRVIVTGTRQLDAGADEVVAEAIRRSGFLLRELVSADSEGAGAAAERWAEVRRVPVVLFGLKRQLYGRQAAYRQAQEMVRYAQALVLVWQGWESNWRQLLGEARFAGLPVCEVLVERKGSRANGVWWVRDERIPLGPAVG